MCREADGRTASGRGGVFSWIVVRHPSPREIVADQVPDIVALIEREEGVRIASNLVNIDPGDVSDGMPVAVTFRHVAPDRILHAFEPVDD